MGATQLRHFKLWYAGRFSNWDLAKYELGQIEASIQDAARYFPNIPAADMTTMTEQVKELRTATEANTNSRSCCFNNVRKGGDGLYNLRVALYVKCGFLELVHNFVHRF